MEDNIHWWWCICLGYYFLYSKGSKLWITKYQATQAQRTQAERVTVKTRIRIQENAATVLSGLRALEVYIVKSKMQNFNC